MLPRSGVPIVSVMEQSLPPSAGPQTVAAAQASWSAAEIAQHQEAVLAAVNCARQQRGQGALSLDSTLSATASGAWLKLVHGPILHDGSCPVGVLPWYTPSDRTWTWLHEVCRLWDEISCHVLAVQSTLFRNYAERAV